MAQTKTKSRAVTTKASTELAVPFDFSADVGSGMEGTSKDDFAIPFLRVLQSNSPQCDEADPEFIPGAQKGMIYNTATGQLISGKEGVIILPCAFQRRFLRWGPRGSEGGGYKGEFMPEDVAIMQRNGEVTEIDGRLFVAREDGKVPRASDGSIMLDRLSDTRSHFVIALDDEGHPENAILALSSTQIKKSKLLMSMLARVKINGQTPPTWMSKIRMTTLPEKNDKGSWYGVKFEAEGFIDSKDLYEAGRDFHQAIAEGEVKVNYASADEGGASSAGDGEDVAF